MCCLLSLLLLAEGVITLSVLSGGVLFALVVHRVFMQRFGSLVAIVLSSLLAITMGSGRKDGKRKSAKEVRKDKEHREADAESRKRMKKLEEQDKYRIARERIREEALARRDKDVAREHRKEAVAKEKARPKRSGELRLRLAGGETDATCVAGLAESFNGFKLLDELDVQSVVDLVMEQEAKVVHGFVHAADGDFRFAGLRSAALVRASLFGGGQQEQGGSKHKTGQTNPLENRAPATQSPPTNLLIARLLIANPIRLANSMRLVLEKSYITIGHHSRKVGIRCSVHYRTDVKMPVVVYLEKTADGAAVDMVTLMLS